MSYGTDFTADVFLNRQSYQNKEQVELAIGDCEKEITDTELRLQMIAIANPKEITPEGEDVLFWHENTISDILEEYRENVVKLYQLSLYIEYLNQNTQE